MQYEWAQWEAESEAAFDNWVNGNRELVDELAAVNAAKHALITRQINLMIAQLQAYNLQITYDITFDAIVQGIQESVVAATDGETTDVQNMELAYGKY